jgi:hypothetical protein
VALPAGVALDRVGPLRDVLAAARPRLIVVTQATAPTGFGVPATQSASGAGDDAAVAAELGAQIVRTSAVGTVSLLRRADGGWSLAAG